MSRQATNLGRRRFLKTALSAGAAVIAAPQIIPSTALGRDGAVPPSERIVLGGIGIGNRGTYDLGCFLNKKMCNLSPYATSRSRAAPPSRSWPTTSTAIQLRDVSRLSRAARSARH